MRRPELLPSKRNEALARQAERAARTDEEQLERLDLYGWAANRERARLVMRIEARS